MKYNFAFIWWITFMMFISTVLVLCFVFYAFPLSSYDILWERHVWNVPFLIVPLTFPPTIGLILGIIFYTYNQREWKIAKQTLADIGSGRAISEEEKLKKSLPYVAEEMVQLQQNVRDQTKRAQQLATEDAVEMEKRIQETISQERHRLARELHDSVSQQLFAASMMMSILTENQTEETEPKLKTLQMIEKMVHQSQLEMRALLLHLRPVLLKDKTLSKGMEELLNDLEKKVPFHIERKIEDLSHEKGVEDHLFRIFQESISNILRHAGAKEVQVMLLNRDGQLILRIEDDGVGFESVKEKAGSYGLQTMQERAAEIGGTIKLVSVPNKGTRVEVQVPLV